MKLLFTYGSALKGRQIGLTVIVLALLAVWIYALVDQLFSFSAFRNGMMRHALPPWLAQIVGWSIPIAEAVIILLLVSTRWLTWGLKLSALLLFTFTIYIGLGLMTPWVVFECFCSKFINGLSWWGHFWLNISLLATSVGGLQFHRTLQRGEGIQDTAAEGGSAK